MDPLPLHIWFINAAISTSAHLVNTHGGSVSGMTYVICAVIGVDDGLVCTVLMLEHTQE